MIKISAAIITYNEERHIGDCIDSVRAVADEVVVVDSFSTDKTEAICNEKGVRFYKHPYTGMIEQKNYAAALADFDWVLSMDADERLSDEMITSILEIKKGPDADGYSFNRLNHYCGAWIRHCGWYPDTKLRLFDKNKGSFKGVNPHDKYELNPGCRHRKLNGDILHFTYDNHQAHRQKLMNYAKIAAQHYHNMGKSANYLLLILKPLFTFIKKYFFQLGFLDGYRGYLISRISAEYVFHRTRMLINLLNAKSE